MRTIWIMTALITALTAPDVVSQVLDEGGRLAGLAGAGAALEDDAWGRLNPASVSRLERVTVAINASQAFGLQELRHGAIHLSLPFRRMVIGAGARTFGFENYRQTTYSLTTAGRLTRTAGDFHAGLRIEYEHVSIPGYGSAGAAGVSIGWVYSVLAGFHLGGSADNLFATRLASEENRPSRIRSGFAYSPGMLFTLVGDVVKDVRFPLAAAAGLELRPVEEVAIRIGAGTVPIRFATGIGIYLGGLAVDLAAERHLLLGWTPGLAVALSW